MKKNNLACVGNGSVIERMYLEGLHASLCERGDGGAGMELHISTEGNGGACHYALRSISHLYETMNNQLAIVGRGKSRKYLEYQDDMDYWAFNDNAMSVPAGRLTAMFEMHGDLWTTERYNVVGAEGYRDWLKQRHGFPIFMHAADGLVPSSREYPLEAARQLCSHVLVGGKSVRDFFTSSTPYALALAILSGYKRVEMWGIELDTGTEYEKARNSIFFWLGIAAGRGVEIALHESNRLFDAELYWAVKK